MRVHLLAISVVVCAATCTEKTASAQNTSTFGDTSANRSFSSDTSYSSDRNYGGSSTAGGSSALRGLGGQEELELEKLEGAVRLFSPDQFRVGSRKVGQFVGSSLFDPSLFVGAATSGRQSAAGSSRGLSPQRGGTQGNTRGGMGSNRFPPGMGEPGLGGPGGPGGRSGPTQVRAAMRMAFQAPQIDASQINAALVQRLQRSDHVQIRLPVEVTVEGRTVTLRGQVATAYDRILAERFVRLEPGISQVANELVVAQDPALPVVDPTPALTPAETN